MDDAPPDHLRDLADHFTGVVATLGSNGPVGEIMASLAMGCLDPVAFAAITRQHGVATEPWFRDQLLDLVLGYVRAGLEHGPLTATREAAVHALRAWLHVRDGELLRRRPAELADILGIQLDRILDDATIDATEELEQVELQALFGLGYDQYLALIRRRIELIMADLCATRDASDGETHSATVRKLAALEPLHWLVTSRARTLGPPS